MQAEITAGERTDLPVGASISSPEKIHKMQNQAGILAITWNEMVEVKEKLQVQQAETRLRNHRRSASCVYKRTPPPLQVTWDTSERPVGQI